jgi:2-isopropylmalate synthase
VLVSELSGRRNVLAKLREQGVELDLSDAQASEALEQVKAQEARGYQFESAEASFELLVRRLQDGYVRPFKLEDFLIVQRRRHLESGSDRTEMQSEAMVKLRIGEHLSQVAADGNGPVSALDAAVRKALIEVHPEIDQVHLMDYKVRIIDSGAGADAAVRVLVESGDRLHLWRTVGASTDVVEASWLALQDSYEFWLLHWGEQRVR